MDKLEGIKDGDTVEVSFGGKILSIDSVGFDVLVEGVSAKSFTVHHMQSSSFSIKKVEPPIAVGDRVRFRSNDMSTTGVVLALDGIVSVIRFEPPSGGEYYDGIRTDLLVRA
jgi:phosphomevalonate kinase